MLCEWKDCDALASKHVRLRFQIFEGVDGPCGSAMLPVEHHDVCDKHLDEADLHYREVTVFDIAGCQFLGRSN